MDVGGFVFSLIALSGLSFAFGRWALYERQLRPQVRAARGRGLVWSGRVDARMTWNSSPISKAPLLRGFGWLPVRSFGTVAWVYPGAIEIGSRFIAPGAHWLFASGSTWVEVGGEPMLPGDGWLILRTDDRDLAVRSINPCELRAALGQSGFRVFA